MTPERLAELRRMTPLRLEELRRLYSPDCASVLRKSSLRARYQELLAIKDALLDLVEAQRRALEITDGLADSVGDLLMFFATRNEFFGERVEAAAHRRLAAYDEARKETKP